MFSVPRYPCPLTPRCGICGTPLVWCDGEPYCPVCDSWEPTGLPWPDDDDALIRCSHGFGEGEECPACGPL